MIEIDPHRPVDSVAARVVSKVKDVQRELNPGSKITSMSPLPTKMWHGRKCDDLTGKKCGTFTVIGCALFMPKNYITSSNNTRWVVRCYCGRYQMLTTRAVKKNNDELRCIECTKYKIL